MILAVPRLAIFSFVIVIQPEKETLTMTLPSLSTPSLILQRLLFLLVPV